MQIARKSPFSGRLHTMELPVTEQQILDYKNGAMIQDAFPNLTPAEREFFKTGITPEEWDEAFKEEDE
jgi:hypothetical protein